MPLNETPPMKSFCVRHWTQPCGGSMDGRES